MQLLDLHRLCSVLSRKFQSEDRSTSNVTPDGRRRSLDYLDQDTINYRAHSHQWAAQLADHLLAINKDDSDAKQIKADALTKLARNMLNATARNYYLTVARELREQTQPK